MTKKAARKRGRGRPAHKPTPALRRKVSAAVGGGMRQDEIATALGLDEGTLRKYYGPELNQVAFQKRMDVLDAHYRSAMKGNVAAQKSYLAREPVNPIPPAPSDKPAPPLGKKEAAELAATGAEVGTGWEGDLPDHRTVQ